MTNLRLVRVCFGVSLVGAPVSAREVLAALLAPHGTATRGRVRTLVRAARLRVSRLWTLGLLQMNRHF